MALATPKIIGADIELGNFILDRNRPLDRPSGYAAACALLREIRGLPRVWTTAKAADLRCPVHGDGGSGTVPYRSVLACTCGEGSQDWARRFLPANGGCIYIDLGHLELALPELRSAFDFVAGWHAMLRIARAARERANRRQPRGRTIQVLVNNSDGRGHAYGSHMSFLMHRAAYRRLFDRKLHHLLHFASFLVSSIVWSGSGKVGSENDQPDADFQIGQRADFFETLCGEQTTFRRPVVNARDESLTDDEKLARLHVIFFDNTLCHGSSLLKAGVTQIVVAMLEQDHVRSDLILDDPLGALAEWSRDTNLRTTAALMNGSRYTAVGLQWAILEAASRFVATGRAEGIVPRAHEIMALWEDTLTKLEGGELDALRGRLDWVLKKAILERAMERQGLSWSSREIRYLDHLYSSLDADEGLYWAYERSGVVERQVTEAEVDRLVCEPPEDTRAWSRASLLRRVRADWIDRVDWDSVRFVRGVLRHAPGRGGVTLGNPCLHTRAHAEAIFQESRTLDALVEGLSEPAQDHGVQELEVGGGRKTDSAPTLPPARAMRATDRPGGSGGN